MNARLETDSMVTEQKSIRPKYARIHIDDAFTTHTHTHTHNTLKFRVNDAHTRIHTLTHTHTHRDTPTM